MGELKSKVRRRSTSGVRSKKSLTMAFMTSGVALPKGAARLTLTASSSAVEALTGKPTKVRWLLQRYGEAFAKSHKEGRSISFRVDVNPDGAAIITAVDEAPQKSGAVAVEDAGEPAKELEDALATARERGRNAAAEILAGEDMVSAETLAEMLRTSRMTINTKRQNGHLLGLDGAKRGYRFPIWQLNDEGKPYPELPILLERLGGPWAVYRFLVQRHGELDGLTGRQALARGKGKAVLSAAESVGRGDFS